VVTSASDAHANVIFGAVIDESLDDEVRVTVIATGFGHRQKRRRLEAGAAAPANSHRETPFMPPPREIPTDTELEIPSFLRED
jgi:cell division protein FtsZ